MNKLVCICALMTIKWDWLGYCHYSFGKPIHYNSSWFPFVLGLFEFEFLDCRFLQGPETDPETVRKIREAIDNQTDVTVQLINYTKSGMLAFAISDSRLALSALSLSCSIAFNKKWKKKKKKEKKIQ